MGIYRSFIVLSWTGSVLGNEYTCRGGNFHKYLFLNHGSAPHEKKKWLLKRSIDSPFSEGLGGQESKQEIAKMSPCEKLWKIHSPK